MTESTRRFGLRRRGRKESTVALAGAGYIAVVHALAARAAGLKVSAVASRGSSARHLAGELDARRCRPEDLPAGADVLVVATPPDHHVDLALQGLAAGASVLVEKPLASTLAAADRLVDAAARIEAEAPTGTGGTRRIRCAENLLHAPFWRAALELRPSMGPLGHLSLRTQQPPPDWGHFAEPLTSGGVLFDLGPHPIALALGLADEPVVAVSAALTSTRDDGADDDASVRIRFGSGLVAELAVSWTSPTPTWDVQAASDQGVLRIELLPELLLEHNGEPVPLPARHDVVDPRLEQFGYVDQLLDLVDDEHGDDRGQDLTAARQVLEVICAAYRSAGLGGAEVSLPFDGDRSATPMSLWRGAADRPPEG